MWCWQGVYLGLDLHNGTVHIRLELALAILLHFNHLLKDLLVVNVSYQLGKIHPEYG